MSNSCLTSYELGWLVGLLEGEAYFGLNHQGKKTPVFHFALDMVDEDIVLKASNTISKILNKPCTVRAFDRKDRICQQSFRLVLYGDNAKRVMQAVVPYMGYRRRKRIWQSLNKHIPKVPTVKLDLASLFKTSNVVSIQRRV